MPDDTKTYVEATGTVAVQVNRAAQSAAVSMADYTYNDAPSMPSLTYQVGDGSAVYYYGTENAASGIGLCVLLGLVALAVSIFLRTSAEAKEYRFLEEEPFETEYGVEGMVRQRQREYKDTHTRLVTVGVVLCVLAAVPLFAAMCISGSDLLYIAAVCALLVLVAIGCLALVTAGVYQGAMEQLLEEGDYTRPQKKHHKLRGTVTMIYWLAATAVFLLYTYGPNGNGQPQYSWIIWAVAGVLYSAVMGIVRIISQPRLNRAPTGHCYRDSGEKTRRNPHAGHSTSDQDLRREEGRGRPDAAHRPRRDLRLHRP